MKKNSTVIGLFTVFILIILSMYFINKRLVSEIESDLENDKTIKAANFVEKVQKEGLSSKAVKDLEASMNKENISQFEKDFMEKEDPIYEPPLENIILMQ